MNKSDWSKAPEWAKYHAVDEDGDVYWYEIKPNPVGHGWHWNGGHFDQDTETSLRWRDTLQERPEKEEK